MDRKEKQRYEQRIAELESGREELERKRKEDNLWWQEYTSRQEERQREEHEEDQRIRREERKELVDSFNRVGDAILVAIGQGPTSPSDNGQPPEAPEGEENSPA